MRDVMGKITVNGRGLTNEDFTSPECLANRPGFRLSHVGRISQRFQ